MTTVYEADFPIPTISEANTKEHWGIRASRVKTQRNSACYLCRIKFGRINLPENFKLRIYLSRLSLRKLDDDNLTSAFKAVRDGIADYLGIDDGDDRISWNYSQGKHKECSCHVAIAIDEE